MKNATVDSKTAKDYPIGTRFRWNSPDGYWFELIDYDCPVSGGCEMVMMGERRVCVDHNDLIFRDNRVEIVYPKSDNFNTLYEKLNSTNL